MASHVFEVKIETARALAFLKNGEKRLRFAIVNAINKTAKDVQKDERALVEQQMVVRKKSFIQRQAAIISPFASVSKMRYFARIRLGEKPRLLLRTFTTGGTRQPFTPGAKNVAVPAIGGARPTKRSEVAPEFLVKRLHLKKKVGRGIVGRMGTYVVPNVGIFQNVPQSNLGRLLYPFVKHLRIEKVLDWLGVARRTANQKLQPNLSKEVRETLAHQLKLG